MGEFLLDTCKIIAVEANEDKFKCMFMSCHQKANDIIIVHLWIHL